MKGHSAPIHRIDFSKDSKALVSASLDGTSLTWDVSHVIGPSQLQLRPERPEKSLAELWSDLADDDGSRAFSAILKLTETPMQSLRLMNDRLPPASAPDPSRVARLIVNLNHEEFQIRDKATKELELLHELAAPALEKALKAQPSPEARRRLEALLERVQHHRLPGGTARAIRAVEVLEAINGPEARQLLEALAIGAPEAQLTKDAKAALERLSIKANSQVRR
jgi:hypothetical protein